jgi:fumarate reductase flavoprotein subunit
LAACVSAALAAGFSAPALSADVNLNADVVVVGAGGAGMAAAVRAAELGANVVLLEKNPFVGGGASFAEGLFGIQSEWQREKNYGLSIPQAAEYLQRFDHFLSDGKLRRLYLEQSAGTLNWLSKHDITFEAIQVSPAETLTWHVIGKYKDVNHGAAYIAALKDHADKLGVKTYLRTPATELIMKDGKVSGIKAKSKDDNYTITTSNVILATGGFGDNPKLVKELLGYDPARIKSSVPLNKTGDGYLMARAAGADLTKATAVMHSGTEGAGIQFLDNTYVMSWQPANLWVNNRGERFAPETLTFEFSLAGNAIASQYKNEAWAIFDDAAIEYVKTKGVDVGVGVLIPTMTKLDKISEQLAGALAAKSEAVKKAGSIEELAGQIGVPAEALKQTLAQYNKYAADQHDPEFFKPAAWMRPIGKGSLYAVKIRPYWFCTLGGIRTDRGMHVLNTEDKPIAGLYATGAEVGNVYGDTYTTWTSGHLFGFAAWSGKTAAENAVKSLKK